MFHNETTGACVCSNIPYRAVLCDPTIPRTSILDCYCMAYNSELGRCLYGCGHKQDILYYKLPQNELLLNRYTCSKAKRDSTLCGACQPGYSPLVYSYNMSCMNCTGMTYNWIKYIAVAYIPLTFFYFLVVICRFSGTSPLVKSYINICQGIVSPMSLRAFMTVASRKQFTELSLKILGSCHLEFRFLSHSTSSYNMSRHYSPSSSCFGLCYCLLSSAISCHDLHSNQSSQS